MGDSYLERLTADWSPGRATGVDSTEMDHEPYTSPAPPPDVGAKPPLCRTCLMHHRAGENTLCSRFDPEPAPPAPAELERGWLAPVLAEATRQAKAIDVAFAPAPEAKGEMAAPAVVASVYRTFRDMLGEIDSKATWMRASLTELEEEYVKARTRAREAEEERDNANEERDAYGALVAELRHERDEAREQRDAIRKHSSAEIGRLGLEVARLRDDFAAANARAEEAEELSNGLASQLGQADAARLRAEAERDVALTEANDLRLRVERLVAGAANLTERAEEAEEELRLADFRVRSAESRADGLRERLAAAEAEVKRLNGVVDEHAGAAMRAGLELDRERAEHAKLIGLGKEYREFHIGRLEAENAVLRERNRRLEEAGDAMVEAECYDWPNLVARWLAAKADAPAAKEPK